MSQHPQLQHVVCLQPGDSVGRGASRRLQHSSFLPTHRARHSHSCRSLALLQSCSIIRLCRRPELKSLLTQRIKVIYVPRPPPRFSRSTLPGVIRFSHNHRANLLWRSSFLRDWVIPSFSLSSLCGPVRRTNVYQCCRSGHLWYFYLDGLFGSLAVNFLRNCFQDTLLVRTYGAINGIAPGCSCSMTTLAHQTPFPTFVAPTGRSGMSCAACSSRPLVTPFGIRYPRSLAP